MAPGPKRKNFNKRAGDLTDVTSRNIKNTQEPPVDPKVPLTAATNDNSNRFDNCTTQSGRKYDKRSVTSNWSKYDEPVEDPHADALRGEDFEVLLSYCGGSESQMKLQDEKEWEEAGVSDKSISLDFQDLAHALKSIPLHQRIDLPEDIFDKNQISLFNSYAESMKASYMSKSGLEFVPKKKEEPVKMEIFDESLNIIDGGEVDEDVCDILPVKAPVLDEKTENIIDSLASCLSLKSSVKDKIENITTKAEAPSDELDFLLSLSVSANAVKETKQVEKPVVKKATNVDDWLNSLLDD